MGNLAIKKIEGTKVNLDPYNDNWASSRENLSNLSSVFPTKRDSNQSPQIHRQARKMKFHW